MNIIDLCYCVFYRYDEKYNIGFPVFGALISLASILGLYILAVIVLLGTFVVDSLPDIGKWQFAVIWAAFCAVVYLPFRTKEIRSEKLQKFDEYKKTHHRKYLWRFWLFVALSNVMLIGSFVVGNLRYYEVI